MLCRRVSDDLNTPNQVECARGSLNQIPPYCTFSGDIRLTPFYDIKDLKAKVERYDGLSRLMGNHS